MEITTEAELDEALERIERTIGWSGHGFVGVVLSEAPERTRRLHDRLAQRLEAMLDLYPRRADELLPLVASVLAPPEGVRCVWLEALESSAPWRQAWLEFFMQLNGIRDRLRTPGRGALLLVCPGRWRDVLAEVAPDLWSRLELKLEVRAHSLMDTVPALAERHPTSGQLGPHDVNAIVQLALESGLADPGRRDLLLAWLPRPLVGNLKVFARPADQILSDVTSLLQWGGDGTPPLVTWLESAARLTDYLPGVAARFLEWKRRLERAERAGPPAGTPAGTAGRPAAAQPAGHDVFIAYPSAERPVATALADALRARGTTVFLDHQSLRPGELWDEAIPRALERARLAVVLVSSHTQAAWYQREEIAHAIDLSRRQKLRLVPVALDAQALGPDVPYGLRRVHGIHLHAVGVQGVVDAVAEALAA